MPAIFVYGTLKRGGKNHRRLSGQKFLHAARTVAGYTLYQPADYPGMVPTTDYAAGVTGEVWLVTPACLKQLDAFEGVAEQLYARAPVALAPPHAGAMVESYLYLRPLNNCPHHGSTWPEPV